MKSMFSLHRIFVAILFSSSLAQAAVSPVPSCLEDSLKGANRGRVQVDCSQFLNADKSIGTRCNARVVRTQDSITVTESDSCGLEDIFAYQDDLTEAGWDRPGYIDEHGNISPAHHLPSACVVTMPDTNSCQYRCNTSGCGPVTSYLISTLNFT